METLADVCFNVERKRPESLRQIADLDFNVGMKLRDTQGKGGRVRRGAVGGIVSYIYIYICIHTHT